MRDSADVLSICFFDLDNFGGRHDLPDVPRRVFGNVKKQPENARRQFFTPDETLFK